MAERDSLDTGMGTGNFGQTSHDISDEETSLWSVDRLAAAIRETPGADQLATRLEQVPVGPPTSSGALLDALRTVSASGARVGRYVLLESLGTGAMGYVYVAFDPDLARRVAIKLIRPELDIGGASPGGARERLLREAQACARLKHPNVVTVYEAGIASNVAFIAMEYVEGLSAGQWMKRAKKDGRTNPWPRVLDIFLQAGRGLAAAHKAGILHRDFKPDNVLIDEEGRARVTDFGLAGRVEYDDETDDALDPKLSEAMASAPLQRSMTMTGSVMGTPSFMAPEQHQTARVDERADQYAFAVALYEALYGVRPFEGDSLTSLLYAKLHMKVTPPPRNHGVPRWIRPIVMRALSTKPEDRWPDMATLLAALQADPTPKRRLLAVAGVGVAAVLATMAGYGIERSRSKTACEVEGADVENVWNTEIADAVSTRIASATSVANVEGWERARARADTWSEAWSRARTDACLAERFERRGDRQRMLQSIECLDEQRVTFERMVENWKSLETEKMYRTARQAWSLPRLEDCSDPRLLELRGDLDEDPARREAQSSARKHLAAASALNSVGAHDEALVELERASAGAQSVEDRRLLASIALERGAVLHAQGKAPDAIGHFEKAYLGAVGSGQDRVALQAATRLLRIRANVVRDFDDAVMWRDLALAQAERLELEDGAPLRASIEHGIGLLTNAQGRPLDAIPHYEKALAAYESTLGPDVPEIAEVLGSMGASYASIQEVDEASHVLERAIEIIEKRYGPNHPSLSGPLSTLSTVVAIGGDLERGQAYFDRGLEIQVRTFGEVHGRIANAWHNWAIAQAQLGRYEDATKMLERSVEINEGAYGELSSQVARSLLAASEMYLRADDLDAALAATRRGLSIAQALYDEDDPRVARHWLMIGRTQLRLGDTRHAVQSLETAIRIEARPPGQETLFTADMIQFLAQAHERRGELSSAIAQYERAVEVHTSLGSPASRIAENEWALAELLWKARDDRERATELAKRALAHLEGSASASRHDDTREEIAAWLTTHG